MKVGKYKIKIRAVPQFLYFLQNEDLGRQFNQPKYFIYFQINKEHKAKMKKRKKYKVYNHKFEKEIKEFQKHIKTRINKAQKQKRINKAQKQKR